MWVANTGYVNTLSEPADWNTIGSLITEESYHNNAGWNARDKKDELDPESASLGCSPDSTFYLWVLGSSSPTLPSPPYVKT